MFDGGGQIRDLTFVRHAQELGFSLIEIKELLALRQKHHVCSEVQSMLNHKLEAVREKINGLSRDAKSRAHFNCSNWHESVGKFHVLPESQMEGKIVITTPAGQPPAQPASRLRIISASFRESE